MATEILDTSPTLLKCIGAPFLVTRGYAVCVCWSVIRVCCGGRYGTIISHFERKVFFIFTHAIHSTKARADRIQIVKMIVIAIRKQTASFILCIFLKALESKHNVYSAFFTLFTSLAYVVWPWYQVCPQTNGDESHKSISKNTKPIISPKKVKGWTYAEYLTAVKVVWLVRCMCQAFSIHYICTLLRSAKGLRVSAHLPEAQTFQFVRYWSTELP